MPPASSLTVAWISDFPIEWLPDIPESLRELPREHPATWEMVLLSEFEQNPSLCVHVIILRKNIARSFSFQRNGVTFHLLKYLGGTRGSTLFWLDTLLIRRALRRIKPDIVHAWGSERGAALVASRLDYPSLITVQGLLSWYQEVIPGATYDKFGAWMEKLSFARARHVTTESKFAVAYLQKKYPQLTVHQIEHAPNWTFHQIERQPAAVPIRFMYNGTLCYRKGTDLLLLALNELAPEFPFDLLVIGSPTEPFLAPFMAGLSPEFRDRIVFKSGLPPTEIARELSRATLLLLPTRADTSPNAVKEAVAAGVPVVASNVGGIPDYVIPGENGFLFTSGDKAEFVAMIRAAVVHPLFSRGLVTPASLAKNREYLSPARMARLFLSAYQKVKSFPARAAPDGVKP
jgi:glycosyltransferase involved in cell wall biosynthesis